MKKLTIRIWGRLVELARGAWDLIERVVVVLRQAWRDHRRRLTENRAYGPALVGVVAAACELVFHDPRITAVVLAVTTAYITISGGTPDVVPEEDWRWET